MHFNQVGDRILRPHMMDAGQATIFYWMLQNLDADAKVTIACDGHEAWIPMRVLRLLLDAVEIWGQNEAVLVEVSDEVLIEDIPDLTGLPIAEVRAMIEAGDLPTREPNVTEPVVDLAFVTQLMPPPDPLYD